MVLTIADKKIYRTYLTTGNKSGIGRYIYENLGGVGLDRSTSINEIENIKNKGVDVIIHCAFNSLKVITNQNVYDYIQDNLFLTKEIISSPHKKFIYISSVDVYPKDGKKHFEDEIIDVNSIKSIYAITKLISESFVSKFCKNYLIIRPTAFLGKYSRSNSLIRILEKDCKLSLSANSRFNYILYSDVFNFIKYSIENDLKGIYNISSRENITLKEVVSLLDKKVKFGEYFYDVGIIDNQKIASLYPVFRNTSKEVILRFINDRYNVSIQKNPP